MHGWPCSRPHKGSELGMGTDMNEQNIDEAEIVREAAGWVERLSDRVDAKTLKAFTEWVRASPIHARYYTAQSAVDAALREHVLSAGGAGGAVANLVPRASGVG